MVVVGSLSLVFQARVNLWLSMTATGIVALAVQPVRTHVQRLANVLLYGARDEPYAVTARLGERLESALPPAAVLPTVVSTVAADLKLPYVAIMLDRADGRVEVGAATGVQPEGSTLELPLFYQGERIGSLVAAPRPGEAHLAASDRRLLTDLARQIGMAAHAVRLAGALQRAREDLVTAREEERRRLRRDLHDGLGPELAAIAMLGDAARGALRHEPDEADALLVELTEQARATIGNVRRLIHALRPPVLDDLGLLVALQALAMSLGISGPAIVIRAPKMLPSMPAAVEVAAYRIVQEAVTNAVKHAAARQCAIDLTWRGDVLAIRVVDDGCGVPADRVAGVGLASMRERAEELGGRFEMMSGADGGTVVMVEFSLGRGDGADSFVDR